MHGALGILPGVQQDHVTPADINGNQSGGPLAATIGASSSNAPAAAAPWWNRSLGFRAGGSSNAVVNRLGATDPAASANAAPRIAFAELPSFGNGSRTSQRLSNISIVTACAAEAAAVVPTVLVELQLAKDSWSVFLRVMISIVRLSPLLAPCLPCCGRLIGCCGCRFIRGPLRRRFMECGTALITASFCPEVRWGVAITLDMWYLLSTPLNKGLHHVPLIVLLVCNVLLCFGDTVMLIMMLAAKGDDLPEAERVEQDAVHPDPIIFPSDEASVAKFDPTCIICLSDFKGGDHVVQLPCNHTFHTECIGKWLAKSRHCPLRCPQIVLPPVVTQTHVEAMRAPSTEARSAPSSASTGAAEAP